MQRQPQASAEEMSETRQPKRSRRDYNHPSQYQSYKNQEALLQRNN
jgi:hypothetical protein